MSIFLPARRFLGGASWAKNTLWTRARAVPSLDLRLADNKSLVDATTGQNLVSFTRASSGTYVDSQGVIRLATTNLLLRSEEIGTSPWGTNNAGATTYTANAIAAPTGAVTADRVTATADFAGPNQFVSAISGLNYSLSFYVKAVTPGSLDSIRIECFSARFATFNVTTRVFSGVNAAITPSSVSIGDGWVRVQCLFAAPSTGSLAVAVYASTSSDFYLWGAQLEQSSTVGEYIPTTSTINSAPRFDHNPTTGESLGLLVEESRTNLVTYSACDANWAADSSATYNLGLSALGLFSGVQVNSGGQIWHTIFRSGINLTGLVAYAFTVFYRAGTSGRARITFRNNTLSTETVLTGSVGSLGAITSAAGSVTVLSQYRWSDGLTYVITGTFTPASTSADHWIRIGPDSTTPGQTVIALGAQLEAGAFPTSYIPTTTATATRSADVASISGSNFSSWFSSSAITIHTEASSTSGAAYSGYVYTIGSSFNDSITHYRQSDFQPVARVRTASVDEYGAIGNGSIWTGTSSNKFALALSATSGRQASNGSLSTGGDDTSIALPSMSSMTIGALVGGSLSFNGTIRRLTYWPQRLSNSALQSITQ